MTDQNTPYGTPGKGGVPDYLTRTPEYRVRKSFGERVADVLGCGNNPNRPGRIKRGGAKRKKTKKKRARTRKTIIRPRTRTKSRSRTRKKRR